MKKIIVLIFLLPIFISFAQENNSEVFSGILSLDAQKSLENSQSINFDNQNSVINKKSALASAGLSLFLPGAGQFHNGDYWKTAVFLAVETAGIVTAVIYNNKGDDQTTHFQDIANSNWSVNRYAQWSLDNAQRLSSGISDDQIANFNANMFTNGAVNWNVLNDLESAIGLQSSSGYSHRLRAFGEQQYYEMIGKYDQFNPGWADFTEDPNNPFTYGDAVTGMFTSYSHQRGIANDFYSTSKTAVIIVILNHVISALEAAWTTSRYNKKLEAKVSLETKNIGFVKVVYPQLNMRLNF